MTDNLLPLSLVYVVERIGVSLMSIEKTLAW